MQHRLRKANGYTLVELIAVMVLIGILGAVGANRFFARQTFDLRAFGDQTVSMLRYAQKLAIAQHRNVHVRIGGGSIALCYEFQCALADQVHSPSGSSTSQAACGNSNDWFCAAVPRELTVSHDAVTAALTPLFFDAGGQPHVNSVDGATSTPQTATVAVTIRDQDNTAYTVLIENDTGYVHQ
jgi:MSHA pilin protein MshC